MHKFAALLTHCLLMTIEILHLTLLVILVHQNFGGGFILLTILFKQAKPKVKEFKNKPILDYDKLVELYGKDRATGEQSKIVVKCS